LDEEIVKN